MIPYFKVQYISPIGAQADLTPYVLTLQINKGTESRKNTLSIELDNFQGRLNQLGGEEWKLDDSQFLVWLSWEPINITTDTPTMVAVLSSVSFPMDVNGKYKIKLKALDKTELFLSKLWAGAIIEKTNWNVSDTIINLIDSVNELDDTTKGPLTTNNVAKAKQDGTPFPKPITFSKIWKPAYEWINELSETKFTGEDRPYVYWVDANNDLHWHYPHQKPNTFLSAPISNIQTTIPVSTTNGYPENGTILIDNEVIYYKSKDATNFLNCIRGYGFTSATAHVILSKVQGNYLEMGKHEVYSMTIETAEDQSYNFIIYNAGKTPNGYEYLDYHLDESQIGRKFLMKRIDMKSLSDALFYQERKFGSGWGDDPQSMFPRPNNSPLSGGNPYTPTFRDKDGNTITVTSDNQYNTVFVNELKALAINKCEAAFRLGQQKFTAKVQMRGNLGYEPNELISVRSPKFEQTKQLRVKDVKHQLNKGSWITDLELSEDIDKEV